VAAKLKLLSHLYRGCVAAQFNRRGNCAMATSGTAADVSRSVTSNLAALYGMNN